MTLELGEIPAEVCTTRIDGFYRFDIRAGQEARIRFEQSGRVTRQVVIDARAVPRKWNDEIQMNTDMRLFPTLEGLDSALLHAPAGMADLGRRSRRIWCGMSKGRPPWWNAGTYCSNSTLLPVRTNDRPHGN